MFKSKKWIIVAVAAAVVVIAAGIGVAVYADSPTTTPAPAKTVPVDPQKTLADKVAGILGVDAAKVEAAFTQAQKEINAERAAANLKAEEARIDKLVADGKMTADAAAKYKAWLEARPNVEVPAMGAMGQNMPNFKDARPGMGGMMDKGAMPFNRGQVKPTATPTTTAK